jgi:hypothetical protein
VDSRSLQPGQKGNENQGVTHNLVPLKVQDLNSMVQIKKKKQKMKYTERLTFEAEKARALSTKSLIAKSQIPIKHEKTLDGLLLMYSCRVKNPLLAMNSKLSSENIVDVREEDLRYFPNLTKLDLSDNSVNLK